MLKMFKYLNKIEWLQIFACLILIIGQVWLDLKLPDYMAEITKLVQTPGSKMASIWRAGGFMILCALGSLATAVVVSYFASKLSSALAYRIRGKVYKKVSDFSMEEINKFSTSSLITRSTNDITQVQMLIAIGVQALIKAPILAIWAICKISGKSWQWTLSTGCAVAVLIILLSVIIIFALPKFRVVQKLTDNLNKVTRENLTGVRVVRAYNAENYQEQKFEKANTELTKTNLFINRMMAIMTPGMSLIMNGLALAIYWLGAYIINGADWGDKVGLFSDMIVFSSYAMQIVLAFMLLIMIFVLLPRASVSARRINEVLDTVPKVLDGDKESIERGNGLVEFKNVSFKYPDASEYILKNINFQVLPGETVAFIGSTGSGKSTLINLLPRFYDPTEGEILIDGENIKDYKQSDLHDKLGYISQRAVIFSGNVKSNVIFGEKQGLEASEGDLDNALSIAQAKSFVEKLPEKYESHISQSGTNLSGGQKQRLAIARAIARKPEIFIFDDSFSALDYKTDKKLRKELIKQTKGATTFIVAQRIGTIIDADKIIVLEAGNIVGIGTHNQLMKDCEVYKEIALSQLSKEELNNAK